MPQPPPAEGETQARGDRASDDPPLPPSEIFLDYLAIALGGALGATIRFGTAVLLPTATGAWPWATFAVNLLGALLLGALAGLGRHTTRPLLFLTVGLLGSLTTFSTLAHELATRASPAVALAYGLSTLSLGIAAAWLGHAITHARLGDDP